MHTLHQLNSGFVWRPAPAAGKILSETQIRRYDEDGYFLFEGAFTPDEISAVAEAIDPIEKEYERLVREEPDGRASITKADAITFTTHLVAQSPVLNSFSRHPVLRDICDDLIGGNVRLYWDQAVYKKPGNPEEFPWHQDNGYTYIEPQQYLTCWIPLVDATIDNGCPWVVPGIHRMGTLHHQMESAGWQCLSNPDNAVPVEAAAGDIVVFSSLTPHRTGPNLTSATRKAYILQYAPDGAVLRDSGGETVLQNDAARQYLI